MATILEYLARFLAGGLLVCAFTFIAEICKPRRFAGIFSSAPSVLLASLTITLFTSGALHAKLTAQGAIAGAVGMVCYCLCAVPAIRHYNALVGSLVALSLWAMVALLTFIVLGLFIK